MKDLLTRIIDITLEIQKIPAPTFYEGNRAAYVKALFIQEGLEEVHQDQQGNVFGYMPGTDDKNFIVISAHLDTVFPSETDLKITKKGNRIYGPGIGDNCLGVAGLLGLIWMIRERSITIPGGIWFVANVCEEGLGDLKGMKAVVEKLGSDTLAYIILEGTAYGQIFNRGLGVRRYEVKITTEGGHSWGAYGNPSAIHEIAEFISALNAIKLPRNPKTTLNVGIIEGGTSINTIAPEARIEIDLRSEGQDELVDLAEKVEKLAYNIEKEGVQSKINVIGDRPSGMIADDHPLVEIAKSAILAQGDEFNCAIGSTDANIPLSSGYPAITIGLTSGGGVHTIHEYIDTEPIMKGMNQFLDIVKNIWILEE